MQNQKVKKQNGFESCRQLVFGGFAATADFLFDKHNFFINYGKNLIARGWLHQKRSGEATECRQYTIFS